MTRANGPSSWNTKTSYPDWATCQSDLRCSSLCQADTREAAARFAPSSRPSSARKSSRVVPKCGFSVLLVTRCAFPLSLAIPRQPQVRRRRSTLLLHEAVRQDHVRSLEEEDDPSFSVAQLRAHLPQPSPKARQVGMPIGQPYSTVFRSTPICWRSSFGIDRSHSRTGSAPSRVRKNATRTCLAMSVIHRSLGDVGGHYIHARRSTTPTHTNKPCRRAYPSTRSPAGGVAHPYSPAWRNPGQSARACTLQRTQCLSTW